MSCPHGQRGEPETCSQCLGVKAERVIQGVTPLPDGQESINADDWSSKAARLRASRLAGRRARTCAVCGKPGHDRRQPCPVSN